MSALRSHEPKATSPLPVDAGRSPEFGANRGPGIALALGGGFSRGFAHLGVLDVLAQENIPIAAVAGTSIGSLLGAAFVDGISVQQLCKLGRHVSIRDFVRYNRSPLVPAENRITNFLREWLPSTRIEELAIPMAIVATDLDTGAPYVFTRGSLDVAIRASCAFPGLFQPVEHEGHSLADGCIVAPVPTAVAVQMTECCVLGVTVGSNETSAARQIIVRKRARTSGYPSSVAHPIEPSWVRHADLLVEPQVQDIDWTDFSRVEEAHAAGAYAMRLALPHLRQLLAQQADPESVGRTFDYTENSMPR